MKKRPYLKDMKYLIEVIPALFPAIIMCKTPGLKIVEVEKYTEKIYLQDSAYGNVPCLSFDPTCYEFENKLEQDPRQRIMDNVWCWSKIDHNPTCSTALYLGDHKINLGKNTFFFHQEGENKNEFQARYNDSLTNLLESKNYDLKMIELTKYEKLDRAWVLFPTLTAMILTFGISSVSELAISNIKNNEYEWTRVWVPTVIVGGIWFSYENITFEAHPTLYKVTINVH